jgi:hypothetical protein
MDLYPGHDMFDSFCNYQNALLTEFDRLSSEFNFKMIDAAADARTVCAQLKQSILQLLERDSRKTFLARLENGVAAHPAVLQEKPSVRAANSADAGLFTVANTVTAPRLNGNGHHATHHR